jgi:hypothetical protein
MHQRLVARLGHIADDFENSLLDRYGLPERQQGQRVTAKSAVIRIFTVYERLPRAWENGLPNFQNTHGTAPKKNKAYHTMRKTRPAS